MKKLLMAVLVAGMTLSMGAAAMAGAYVNANTGNATILGLPTDLPTVGLDLGCQKGNFGVELSVNETGYISNSLIKLAEIDVKAMVYHDFGTLVTGFIGAGIGIGVNGMNDVIEMNTVTVIGAQINVTRHLAVTIKNTGTSHLIGINSIGLSVKF